MNMSPYSKQLMTLHAGVDIPGVGLEANPANANNMLIWEDIDFSQAIPDTPFVALAKMAMTMGGGDYETASLHSLPAEMILNIYRELTPRDAIATAFAFPEIFMDGNRFHIFYFDATDQLNIPTYPVEGVDHSREPLLHTAIRSGFSTEQITVILGMYEEVCQSAGVDRHTFLNAIFPDNRPVSDVNLHPDNGSGSGSDRSHRSDSTNESEVPLREMMAPLNVAISSLRLDVVVLLLDQGADIEREYRIPGGQRLTPLLYSLYLLRRLRHDSRPPPEQQISQMLEIVAELSRRLTHIPAVVPIPGGEDISRQLMMALMGGADDLVMDILRRNDLILPYRSPLVRTVVYETVVTTPVPMPKVLKIVWQWGMEWRDTNAYRNGTCHSAASAAMAARNISHAVRILQWEIEDDSEGTLQASLRHLCILAEDGSNVDMVKSLGEVLESLNQDETLLRVFLSTFTTRSAAALEMREALLQNPSLINDSTLRFCICYCDRISTAYIIREMLKQGKSMDERLAANGSLFPPPEQPGQWFQTPLTYALALHNYHAAAQLLSVGADPARVPANIRWRVSMARDEIAYGLTQNVEQFVFSSDGNDPADLAGTTRAQAVNGLDYVFQRMMDDPQRPMPSYTQDQFDDDDSNHRSRISQGMEGDVQRPWTI